MKCGNSEVLKQTHEYEGQSENTLSNIALVLSICQSFVMTCNSFKLAGSI